MNILLVPKCVNLFQDKTALTKSNCSLTNTSDFEVTDISETEVKVKFKPSTSTGTNSATLTITDAHSKTCTITLQGTASNPINGIAGSFNDWDGTKNSLNYTNDVAQTTIALTSGETYSFKVRVNSDWRGNTGTMNRKNCTDWDMATNEGDECKITADLTGNYIFIYNKSTGKLTVKYPSTLTLDGNGGTPASQSLTLYIGDEMSSNKFTQPQKTGYDYKSFTITQNSDNNLINTDGTFAASTTYTSSKKWNYVNGTEKTVYAKWAPHTYSITYNDKGGGDYSGTKTGLVTTHTYATATNLVDGSGKKGYTFLGWYTDIDCTDGNKVTTLGATDFSANIILYAKWQANTTNITINKNDGTGGTVSVTAVYDGAISAVTGLTDALRTRTGYTFSEINTTAKSSGTTIITWTGSAWAFAANAGSGTYTDNTPVWKYTENPSLTLNTRWTANPYTVSFYDADDAASSSQILNVTYDAEISSTTVSKPTKSGYIFGGYFTGKSGTGTQLTDANGNLLEVAGYFEKQSTKLYWKHADNVNVYAAWSEEKTCSLTFGITDGTQATNERGSLSITFNETEYKVGGLTGSNPSTATIDGIPSGTTLTINFTHRSGSGVNATTPESWWTTETKTSAALVTYKSAGVYSFVVTDDASIYLWSTLNEYEFGHSVEPAAGGKITTDNGTFIAGPAVQRVLTATPNDGYEFSSWTFSSDKVVPSGSQTTTTNPLTITLKNSSDESVTANFTPITYSITYNNVEETEYTNPTSYTIESETITLTDASRENYTFDGWFDAETGGNQVTQIALGSTGDKTLWARWSETLHNVNIVPGIGIESVSPAGATNVGNVTPVQIEATVKEGYTWDKWTTDNSSNVTITNANANPTTIKATGRTNVTANATENMTTVTISVNDANMGSVSTSSVSVGVATSKSVTATPKTGYKFVSWTLTDGATLSSGSLTDATITIKGDGVANSTGTASATFAEDLTANWYIKGDKGLLTQCTNSWEKNESYRFSKPSKDAKSAYIDLVITEGQVNKTYEFKLQDCGVSGEPMYGWGTNDGDYHTFTKTETWGIYNNKGSDHNLKITLKMAGTYRFSIDWSSDHNLTVTYPDEGHRMVTVDNGKTQTQVQVNEFTETELVAEQYLNGKRFNGWVVTNTAGEDKSGSITINHSENNSTHMHGATEDGLIVRATYTSDYMVYFKNNPGWDNVYVFFYNQQYYDGSMGTGTKIYLDDKKEWVNDVAIGYPMTRLNEKSDIWYYDYSSVDNAHKTGTIAFNDHDNQNGYQYFNNCQASYRTDWDYTHNLSVFVPEKNVTERKNENRVPYYNKGYWMKYDDLNSGYYLRVSGLTTDGTIYEFKATAAGEPYRTTITLEAGQTKEFWINGSNGSTYKNNGTMTSNGSHTGWDFYEGVSNNCKITTTSEGTYTFTLTCGDGILYVSVEYPLSQNDYRVVYTDTDHPCHPSTFIRKGKDNKDTVSFFIDKGKSPALKFQYCSNISGSTVTWTDVADGTISLEDITETGIYNFYLEQGTNSISCTGNALYNGDFYIRTAIAPGGWDAYLGTDGNTLPYIEYGLDDSQPFKFTHAYTNWVEKDKNVKFCIANDYSLCISDTLVGDNIIGTGDNADWLTVGANIRFMWNKNTNGLSRAYLSGSTNTEERYLVLEGDEKMFDKDSNAIPEGTAETHRAGLKANELNFEDKNNWVYQADIKAQPGCAVKLTAKYNNTVQYFIGTDGDAQGSRDTIIKGSSTDATKYTMRVVYDFKTNRLTAGWVPDGKTIDSEIKLGGDMLITREHQKDAQQVTFGTNGSISEIHNVYAVLTIKKDVMLGKNESGYKTSATNTDYDRTMYWISFPFDVKISEVFGVDGYAKKWIMQRYNGEKRAEIGWFQETETFWEYLAPTSTLQAYKGYLLILNANYFNTEDADVWKNSATEANFYFPSAEKNIGIINKSSVTIDVPEHECKINRTFGDKGEKNHKITDSHWNVIGIPTFQNSTASGVNPKDNDFKSFYEWDPETNGYQAKTALDASIRFNTMQAYMVQYAGKITWENVSVVAKSVAAPKYNYADEKNYLIDLIFSNGEAEDKTYIHLSDEASTNFVLNEDMMKITNAGTPNIYTYAGAYDVAFNETKMDNQTVTIGVSAPKAGTYTFSMPNQFSGTAKLVDLVEGITTDLNVSNYSVDLNKGSYNDRFQLVLEVEAKAPTAMDNVDGGRWNVDGKTLKLLRNGNIYLINGGRVYNATGAEVR